MRIDRKNVNALIFLFCSMFVIACGKDQKPDNMPDRHTDARLQFYLDEFAQDAQKHNVHIDGGVLDSLRVMKFVPDINAEKAARGQDSTGEKGTIGTCATFEEQKQINAGFRKINSKRFSWNEVWIANELASDKSHPLALKELIYHELGHCLLGLEHAQPKPHSIMSPEMSLNGRWLTENWSALLIEFFNSARK